jgi:hypothetical protein
MRKEDLGILVANSTRRPINIYVLDPRKRSEERDQKNEVLLSVIYSRGADPKKRVTFFHSTQGDKPHPFPLMSKGKRNQEHEGCHQCQRGIFLEDWLFSLMSTLVIGFGPQY